MDDRDDQLQRAAAAMAEAVSREVSAAFQPMVDHAKRMRDLASELTLIAGRTSERVKQLSPGGEAKEPIVAELLAFSEIVRSLAGEVRAMADRSTVDLGELQNHLLQTVRSATSGPHRHRDRFDVLLDTRTGRRHPGRDDGSSN
jgi:hypothetical protein